jgi:hypothetical protein
MITHVIIKLQSGEQVMAALEEDSTDYIDVSFPMIIISTPVTDGQRIHEHITAKPLCQFSADKYFRIPKSGILFYKELHEMLVPHYTKIVNSYEDTVLVNPQKKLNCDEPEKMSVEEISKRIDMLADIFGEQESEEDTRVYIEGNETVH